MKNLASSFIHRKSISATEYAGIVILQTIIKNSSNILDIINGNQTPDHFEDFTEISGNHYLVVSINSKDIEELNGSASFNIDMNRLGYNVNYHELTDFDSGETHPEYYVIVDVGLND